MRYKKYQRDTKSINEITTNCISPFLGGASMEKYILKDYSFEEFYQMLLALKDFELLQMLSLIK